MKESGLDTRSAGACPPRSVKSPFFTVARGPVPRDPSNEKKRNRAKKRKKIDISIHLWYHN